jgi:hypothetical protein
MQGIPKYMHEDFLLVELVLIEMCVSESCKINITNVRLMTYS